MSRCRLASLYEAQSCTHFESFEPSIGEGSTNNYEFCVKCLKTMPIKARMFARFREEMGLGTLFFMGSRRLSQGKDFDACFLK